MALFRILNERRVVGCEAEKCGASERRRWESEIQGLKSFPVRERNRYRLIVIPLINWGESFPVEKISEKSSPNMIPSCATFFRSPENSIPLRELMEKFRFQHPPSLRPLSSPFLLFSFWSGADNKRQVSRIFSPKVCEERVGREGPRLEPSSLSTQPKLCRCVDVNENHLVKHIFA